MAWTACVLRRRTRRTSQLHQAGTAAASLALVTLLAGCGSGSPSGASAGSSSAGQSVALKNFAFAPAKLTVTSGTQVTFTNADSSVHTVTANDASFDSGNLAQGKTFAHTFTSPGTFSYHCTIHNYMTATVTVTG